MPDDYYVSQYSGEEIDALLGRAGAGAVRYDAAQTLTDAQKAQARGNINAAPAGFGGFGETLTYITPGNDDTDGSKFDALIEAKFATLPDNNTLQLIFDCYPAVSGSVFFGTLWKSSANYGVLTGWSYSGEIVRKVKFGGAWLPFEWVNPPLTSGKEYRTTERYLGKPVYVKVVDCGNLPSSGLKNIAHGIANCKPIHVYGEMSNDNTLPYATGTYFYISADGDYIQIYVTGDLSGQTAKATIKYTKTTD